MMLSVKDLSVVFDRCVVHNVSFTLRKGRLMVVGPNGAGKRRWYPPLPRPCLQRRRQHFRPGRTPDVNSQLARAALY